MLPNRGAHFQSYFRVYEGQISAVFFHSSGPTCSPPTMLRRCACAALRRSKVHCAQVEPAEAVIRAAYPHVGTSRWRSPLGGRRQRRKSSAFSGRRGGPALTRPSTCIHMMEVVRPHRPPCDGSDEGHASTGATRTRDAEGPPRLPHHIAASALRP